MEMIISFMLEKTISNGVALILSGSAVASICGPLLKSVGVSNRFRILIYSVFGTFGGIASYMFFDIPNRRLELLDIVLVVPGMMIAGFILFGTGVLLPNSNAKSNSN